MRIIKTSVLLFIILLTSSVSGQNYIMQGIIGKKLTILGLFKDGNEIFDARYYHVENKDVVNLESHVIDSTHVLFYTLDANNEDTLSRFNLNFEDHFRQLNGTYAGNDNLQEEVYFAWLDITKTNHQYANNSMVQSFKTEIPFLYTYTSDLKFKGKIKEITGEKFDKITIVKNKAYSIPSIRFSAATPAEKKIEQFCDSLGLEQVVAAIDCGMEYEVTLTVKRMDSKLISIEYTVSWNCGGTNSDYYYQGFTFNRKTGEHILLSSLFNLANEESSNDSLNKLAVKTNEHFIRGLVKETLKNDGGSLCDYDNNPLFGEKNFYVDNESIHFLPYFPKVLASCRGSEVSHVKLIQVMDLMDIGLKGLFTK